jgi:hypothetical protein
MNAQTRRLARLLGIVFVSALLLVPSALAGKAGGQAATNWGPLDPWAYSLVHESQSIPRNWGPLDPWAYSLVHRNATASTRPITSSSSISFKATGFSWRDALIGAGTAVAVMLLAAGGVAVHRRRAHALTA